jgi:MFS family permease
MSLIPDLYRKEARGKAISVFQSSTLIGIIGGTIIAGVLAAALGWRSMFEICGLAGIAVALLLVATVREPAREADAVEVGTGAWLADFAQGLRRIIGRKDVPALLVAYGVSGMMVSVLGAWGPAFLQRSHHVPLADVGVVIGPAVGLGGIAGMLFSGALGDRLVARRGAAHAPLLVPLIALPISAPFLVGFVTAPSLLLTMLSAAVMNFCVSCAAVPCVNYAVASVGARDRGLVSSIMLAAMGVIGAGLGPFIVGGLSDLLTPSYGSEGLRYALMSMIPTPLIAAAFVWLTIRSARKHEATT